ncbi:MAG: radical SAM protein, partial [Spirochaetes bacterium]|nr:radical SAM protein [Spirochaetota bacterium]
MKKRKITIIPVFIPHIGCPHNCVFCNQYAITGISSIISRDEIMQKIQDYRVSARDEGIFELAFFGGSFTAIDQKIMISLLETADDAYQKKLISRIRISTRPDFINEKILTLLKQYHVSIIELGVQSFDDTVLQMSGRGHS